MIIGVPKEIKDHEARVGVTPAGAKALVEAGHTVLVETHAGAQSGFPDHEYQDAGAEIVGEAGYVWTTAKAPRAIRLLRNLTRYTDQPGGPRSARGLTRTQHVVTRHQQCGATVIHPL